MNRVEGGFYIEYLALLSLGSALLFYPDKNLRVVNPAWMTTPTSSNTYLDLAKWDLEEPIRHFSL